MVVIIKIGKRVNRRFKSKLQGPFLIQSMIWKNIEYGINLAVAKMKKFQKKNPHIFSYTKKKYTEDDENNLVYKIEWIEIIIDSTEEIEEEEYNEAMKLFTALENHNLLKKKKDSVEIDEELAKEYKINLKKKGKLKKMLDEGYKRIKSVTLNKSLNDIGILTIVERFKKEK